VQAGQSQMAGSRPVTVDLTPREVEILDFERHWWRYGGAKDAAVRERLGISSTHYYQVMNALLDKPAALAHDPLLVKRLRRLRMARQNQRSMRRLEGQRATRASG
jgi:hypothetical protein